MTLAPSNREGAGNRSLSCSQRPAPDLIQPFSNGSEADNWFDYNCNQCNKSYFNRDQIEDKDPDGSEFDVPECDLENDLTAGELTPVQVERIGGFIPGGASTKCWLSACKEKTPLLHNTGGLYVEPRRTAHCPATLDLFGEKKIMSIWTIQKLRTRRVIRHQRLGHIVGVLESGVTDEDANLIGAAPELYGACKTIVASPYASGTIGTIPTALVDLCVAAIKIAEEKS